MRATIDADAAAEKEFNFPRVTDGELAGIFQEKRPFFREKEAEPVEIHLNVVNFNLGKVCIYRGIKRQARRDTPFHVNAVFLSGLGGGQLTAALIQTERVGRHLQQALTGDFNPFDVTGLGYAIEIEVSIKRRPVRLLIIATDIALKIDTPGLGITGTVAQRQKRNRKFRTPTLICDLSFHLPGRIPIQIEATCSAPATSEAAAASFIDYLSIELHTGRICTEDVTVLAIQQSIDNHTKTVCIIQR